MALCSIGGKGVAVDVWDCEGAAGRRRSSPSPWAKMHLLPYVHDPSFRKV